jgi:serine/threonine protein kinase
MKENWRELQKRKEGLEYAAMMMAAEGLPVPDDLSEELMQVQAELSKIPDLKPPVKAWTSWLGHTVEGFSLRERISSGSYSHIFRGVHEKSGDQCALKIALTDAPVFIDSADYFCKQTLCFQTEICRSLEISPNTVLELECRRLASDTSGHFVKVLSSGTTAECFYYRMPLLSGQSLKELLSLPDTPGLQFIIETFKRLAAVLDRVSAGGGQYHGNLQPDSIFIGKTDVVLLSPGCFDASVPELPDTPLVITTPAYYPFLEKNDLFALGITFWESVCKRHPLAVADLPERPELFAPELKQMLEYRKSLNHAPLWHFLKMATPGSIRADLSSEAEILLIKAVKLAFDSDGFITGDPGFKTPAELAEAIAGLGERGILRRK